MQMWNDHFLAEPRDVIAFAWSAPMRDLAQKIGISDVALRKLLRSQGVATPPQGHWNRVHAGRIVASPPPPPTRRPGETGRIRLDGRFRPHVPASGRMPVGGPFASSEVPEDLASLMARERRAIGKVVMPQDLVQSHPGLAEVIKREERRSAKFAVSGWDWDRPKHDHPLAQRQLRICSAILTALARRDHAGSLRECDGGFEMRVTIGDTSLTFIIELAPKKGRRPPRYNSRNIRELPASTPLRLGLTRQGKYEPIGEWEDGPDGRLDKRLSEIAAAIIVMGEAAFRQSLVAAIEAEEERQRWIEERQRKEIAQLEEKRLIDLRTSGDLLRQAEEIRSLVCRVEQAMRSDSSGSITSARLETWKTWALEQADAIDPVLSGQVLSHLHVPRLDNPA